MIGIDVSKAKVDVLWLKDVAALKAKSKVFSDDRKGHAELLVWLSKQGSRPLNELHVVMEATGIYHKALAHCLFDHQVNVSVLNPARARDFAKGLGAGHKSDKADSHRYGLVAQNDWRTGIRTATDGKRD